MNTEFLQTPEAISVVDNMALEFGYDQELHGDKLQFVFTSFANNFAEYKSVLIRTQLIADLKTQKEQLAETIAGLESGDLSTEDV